MIEVDQPTERHGRTTAVGRPRTPAIDGLLLRLTTGILGALVAAHGRDL